MALPRVFAPPRGGGKAAAALCPEILEIILEKTNAPI